MTGRLRLVDAVIVGAVALLGLKTLGWVTPRPEPPPAGAGPEALPPFARVLAHARTNYVPPDVSMTSAVGKKEETAAAPPPPPAEPAFKPVPSPVSPSERALLERLGERRDELQQRNRDVEMRERLIENAEKKLEGRLNELKVKEEATDAAAAKKNGADGGLKGLVTMYETMKPKDAARVFDRLALDVLVPVVLGMKPAKMAEVLAVMSPEAAEKLTVALATRARTAGAGEGVAALPPNELPAIEPPARAGR